MRTRALLLAFGAASLAACGGLSISAGDYTSVRIASSSASLSGDCMNDPDHTTTFDSGATVLFYGVSGDSADTLYLDTGSGVLEGKLNDDGSYTFTGKTTDVQDQGGTTFTHVQTTTVDFTTDGTQIKGISTIVDDTSCSGNCGGIGNQTCTTKVKFEGVQVEGADVPDP